VTLRERVVEAYGGCCTYCRATDVPLEIDHVAGGGNQHRRAIKIPLATWLTYQHRKRGVWPAGYQLLCQACHTRKTRQSMPAREGAKNINIAVPEHLLLPLEKRAAEGEYGKSKSKVMTAALEAFLGGTPALDATAQFHEHLASCFAELVNQMHAQYAASQKETETVLTGLHTVMTALHGIQSRLEALEQRQAELVAGYDRLKAQQSTPRGLFGRRTH
jgi:hypothetical protein